jgi:hypothetical protein
MPMMWDMTTTRGVLLLMPVADVAAGKQQQTGRGWGSIHGRS